MRGGDARENSGKTGDGKNWGQTGVPRYLVKLFLLSSSGLIGSRFEYEGTGISECLSEMETSNEQRINRPKELRDASARQLRPAAVLALWAGKAPWSAEI